MGNKHKQKSEESIKRMKDSAYKLFALKGFSATSIDDITKEAGYTKGAFYNHFSTKDEIFILIMNERMLAQQEEMIQNIQLIDSLDTREAVRMYLKHLIDITKLEHWTPMFFEFVVHSQRTTGIRESLKIMYENWETAISKILANLEEIGAIKPSLPISLISRTILAMFDGYNIHNFVDGSVNQEEQIEVVVELLNL